MEDEDWGAAQVDANKLGKLLKTSRKRHGWSLAAVAAGVWGKSDRGGDLSKYENGKVPNIKSSTVKLLCKHLEIKGRDIPPRYHWPELRNEVAAKQKSKFEPIAGSLEQLGDTDLPELIYIGAKFSISNAQELSAELLRVEIGKRVEDYKALRGLLDNIDERIPSLGNMKKAAKDAFENLDFHRVERLLAQVHSTELEISAETAEFRASNALLMGRVEAALEIFKAAAASFAATDPEETSRRRLRYVEKLYKHAERTGIGYDQADELARLSLLAIENGELIVDNEKKSIVASIQNLLGSLGFQKTLALDDDTVDISLIEKSIELYRSAQESRIGLGDIASWRSCTINLAQALVLRATRNASSLREDREEAVILLEDVLSEFDDNNDPEWVRAKRCLASAIDARPTRAISQMATMSGNEMEQRKIAREHALQALEYTEKDDSYSLALSYLQLSNLYIDPPTPFHLVKKTEVELGLNYLEQAAKTVSATEYPRIHEVIRINRRGAKMLLNNPKRIRNL